MSNSSGPVAEVKSDNLDQVILLVLDVPELDTLVFRALEHKGETFIKQSLSFKSTMSTAPVPKALNLRKEVEEIIYSLGIPYQDTDFHCPVQTECLSGTHTYDSNLESAIWNLEDDSDIESELDTILDIHKPISPEPAIPESPLNPVESAISQIIVKLNNFTANVPTHTTLGSAGYDLYNC